MKLQGVLPAIVTPIDGSGHVNQNTLARYIEWLSDFPIDGIFALGTTGEGPLLTHEDWAASLRTVLSSVQNKIPVIVQCGGISLAETNWKISQAVSLGADAIALMAPYFYRHSDAVLEDYFAQILQNWPDVDFYLYNIPKYANNVISPETYGRLIGTYDNLLGIKDSSGSMESVTAYIRASADHAVFSGSDAIIAQSFEAGAKGVVSGIAAALPELVTGAWKQVLAGDHSGAETVNRVRTYFHQSSTIAAAKCVLTHRGFEMGSLLPPLEGVGREEQETLIANLIASGGYVGNGG